jgi:hypothetical protein
MNDDYYYSIYKSIVGITFVIVFMISLLNLLTDRNFNNQKIKYTNNPTLFVNLQKNNIH